MSTTYPAILPRPQRSGYALSVSGTTTGTPRERTAARCRAIGLGSRTVSVLTWVFTSDQFAFFAAWWRHDLEHGTQPAHISLPNGHSDAVQPVRFLAPYAAEDLAGRWRVSATVELTAPPRLSGDDIAGLRTMGTLALAQPAYALHHLVHVLMPPRITL